MNRSLWLAFLSLSITACDVNDVHDSVQACAQPSSLQIVEVRGAPATVTQDVTLRGTLVRPPDVTIDALLVGGIAATNVADDFASFSVVVPLATVQSYIGVSDPSATADMVSLPITALTNCPGRDVELTPVTLSIGPRRTSALALTFGGFGSAIDLPTGTTLVPLLVSASKSSTGAKVTITATGGNFAGQTSTEVTLAEDGANASATAFLTAPGTAQNVVVLARSSSEVTAPLELSFIGPPLLQPIDAPLYVSVPLIVHVTSAGSTLTRCRASAPPDVTVMSGAKDLTDENMNGLSASSAAVTISASAGVPDDSIVTLQCYDIHEQIVTGHYTVSL